MTRARAGALLLLVIAAAALAFTLRRPVESAPPRSERPPLLLLTSLPLVFGEDFSLKSGGSRALNALETRYRVVPISVADPA